MNRQAFTARRLALFDRLTADPRVNDRACRVFWKMTGMMNGEHGWQCWASQSKIGKDICCGARTVRRAVALLCAEGYLRQVRGRGRGETACYVLGGDNRTKLSVHSQIDEDCRERVSGQFCPETPDKPDLSPRTNLSANSPVRESSKYNPSNSASLRSAGADAFSPSRGEGARPLNPAEVAAEKLRRQRERQFAHKRGFCSNDGP